jgi:hypothetical protein
MVLLASDASDARDVFVGKDSVEQREIAHAVLVYFAADPPRIDDHVLFVRSFVVPRQLEMNDAVAIP